MFPRARALLPSKNGPGSGRRPWEGAQTMKRQVIVRSLALVLVVLFVGSQAAAEERERGPRHDTSGALVLPVAGMTSAGGTFSGTLTVQRFTTSSNQIFAVGIISGTVYDASGGVLGNLVCQALGLLNSVVNLTGVLNQLLGSLSGVVGGLTGGLGA